jgi:hypothetical protein
VPAGSPFIAPLAGGDDGGDLLSGYAVQAQVDFGRVLDRGPDAGSGGAARTSIGRGTLGGGPPPAACGATANDAGSGPDTASPGFGTRAGTGSR